jgi:hypothetical protein
MTFAESIRPLLNARDPRSVDGAVETATNYLAQCRVINARLARCADYLRRGLRSEAVHLAECHPNILREAEDLQPVDAREVEHLFTSLGLTAPEEPSAAVIQNLRDACETELSLAGLLSQHRTLAVGQGPVRQRLAVLYALAQKDLENPNWQADIRQLEAERVKGIEREFKAAMRDSDLAALEALGHEVSQTPWVKPLPRDLVQKIQKSAQAVRSQARIKELHELVANLLSAREDGDQIECAKLLDEWQTMTSSAQARELDLPADLIANGSESVQSTGAWLTGERRRKLQVQRNSQRHPGEAGHEAAGANRSLLKRGLSAFLSPFRFLVPRRFRSLPADAEPAPGFMRSHAGMDRTI